MKAALSDLSEQYACALKDYLAGAGEAALQRAYEVGRRALAEALGVLDVSAIHREALASVLRECRTPEESVPTVRAATDFFAESLSPHEMALRGFREANEKLRLLNDTLERRTAELTATNQELESVIAELKRADEERDRFFTLSLDMLCIAGFDGYFKRLNPTWGKTLGYTNEQLLAKPYLEFVHPDDREYTLAEAGKLATGTVTVSFENRYLSKDGSYKWLLWNAAPWPERQLIYASARDITERKRAEEEIRTINVELVAANKELDAFTYSVSHDLRAPLRSIEGFSRILLEEYSGHLDAEGRRLFDVIQANARRMAQLIDDLLAFSRLGRREFKKSRINMMDLARAIIDELRRLEPDRAIAITIQPLAPVPGDYAMIRQALTNLLSNAFKFTRRQPHAVVEIGYSQDGRENLYYVKDNGIGFDMRYAQRLFGVFERLHSAEDFAGTGVGLAIVQRVIQRHGGRLWAEGKLNAGATFYFSLPREAEEK